MNEPIDCDFDIAVLGHLKNDCYFCMLKIKQLIAIAIKNRTLMACLPWLDPDRLEYFLSSSGDILNVSIQKKIRKKLSCVPTKKC